MEQARGKMKLRERFGLVGGNELVEGYRQEEGYRQVRNKKEQSVEEVVGEKGGHGQEEQLLNLGLKQVLRQRLEQGLGQELQQELKLEWIEV